MLEFDLKGIPLDSSSYIHVVVKDYETLGKDKYVMALTTHHTTKASHIQTIGLGFFGPCERDYLFVGVEC